MNTIDKHPLRTVTGSLDPKKLNALAASIPTNLPARHGRIIGREKEMQSIQQWLRYDGVRLVTLTGFGGAGKTTLALHTARTMLELFSGGLFFIDLSLVTNPDYILSTIAKTLNLQEEPQREVRETLKDFLVNRSVLFVLDNFEQVISGAPVIAEFLETNPHIRILATSRESLRLRGEQVLPIAALADDESVQMFVQYAQTLNPDFRLTEDNAPAITEICKKLDGLPLAIELAAVRTRMFTPQALLARLTSDLETNSPLLATLTSGPRDMPERQRTLRNMIDWSYNLLAEEEKHMLQAAALFRSGFGIGSLVHVTAIPEIEAEQILASLVDKNLIQPLYGEEMRFHLLESIREFALEQAQASSRWQALQSNFVFAFQMLTQVAVQDIETAEGTHGTPWLKAENKNMLAALEIALKSEDKKILTAGIHVLEGFEHYWFPYCHFSEAKKYLSLAQQCVEESGSDFDKAVVYGLLGTLSWSFFDSQTAVDFHKMSANLFETLGDKKRLGRALNNLAVNLEFLERLKESESYYKQSLQLAQQTGDVLNELRALSNIGNYFAGRYPPEVGEERLGYLHKAQELARRLDRKFELTIIEFNLACLYYLHGEAAMSVPYLERCLTIADEQGYLQTGVFTRGLLAKIAIEQKQYSQARAYLVQTVEVLDGFGFQTLFYEIAEVIAQLCVATRKVEDAVMLYASAVNHLDENPASRVVPISTDVYAKRFEPLKKALGLERFEWLAEKGKCLSHSEVYELAVSLCQSTGDGMPARQAETLFTSRELDVLRLLAQGKTNEEISQQLVVVLKTVEKHVANILRKLGVKNRTEAAAWAMEKGIK